MSKGVYVVFQSNKGEYAKDYVKSRCVKEISKGCEVV